MNKPRICLSCKWRDHNNAQCYDGHLQYKCRQECDGYEWEPLTRYASFKIQEADDDD
jgi:hypothetical protein